jgi:hypothetical protein
LETLPVFPLYYLLPVLCFKWIKLLSCRLTNEQLEALEGRRELLSLSHF